jgi:hypothetical protein
MPVPSDHAHAALAATENKTVPFETASISSLLFVRYKKVALIAQ